MYTIEQDEDSYNIWYVMDPEGINIYRHVGDREDIEALLSHLNR
jgi:hypothetical protein